jgi:uncharacterized membrane protein YgaE (UPF0421/DUF939 family)
MRRWSLRTADTQLALRAALAAGLAVVVAKLLALPFPIYAMISAVIVTDLAPALTRKLAVPRIGATVLGTVLGATIITVLSAGLWWVVPGIMAAMLLSNLLGLRQAAKVAGYICGVVLLDFGDQPWPHALARMVETVVGIGAALLVSFVPKLFPTDRAP